MLTSRRGPGGSNLGHDLMSNKGVSPVNPGLSRLFSSFQERKEVPGKGFGNPNYVNNFDKQLNILKLADNLTEHSKSSCQNFILDSVEEKCPEAIPIVRDLDAPFSEMCFELNTKMSNQSEMMQNKAPQDLSNHSSDTSFSTKPHPIILQDSIRPKPTARVHIEVKRIGCIIIPINKGKEMQVPLAKTPLPNQTCQYSSLDRDDSFIIFDNDEGNHTPRKRIPSLCESEDSFIMFDRDEVESLDDEDDEAFESNGENSDQESSSFESNGENSDQESSSEEIEDGDIDEVDSSFPVVHRKRVRFASNEKLCEVHPMIKWSYAYQAARKGPWEMFARDRGRFRDRTLRLERDIKHFFDPQHRDKVYKERFENL